MKHIILLLTLLLSGGVFAQLRGIVIGSQEGEINPIWGAKVFLIGAKEGAETNESGEFSLILPKTLPDTLIIRATGFIPDTLVITKEDRFASYSITLYSEKELEEVVIQAKQQAKSISKLKILHVEELSLKELRKAACCNLAESFETNVSVDVNYTDAVSGARTIQMMGLEGTYTQIQMENIPYLRGLEQPFGLATMPGTWINSIQITKGTGTVINGYESMAGLVNIELFKPEKMDKLFVNFYSNAYTRNEFNIHGSMHVGKRWNTALFGHASGAIVPMDNNKDGFMDMPIGGLVSFNNRWSYEGKKMEAQLGVNAYYDNRFGGQTNFRPWKSDSTLYGLHTINQHIDVYAKTGFFLKKPRTSIGVVYNLKYHSTFAQYGHRRFDGEEKRGYVNAIFESEIGSPLHKYKLGVSGVFVDFKQQMGPLNDNRMEVVPGMFGEYTYGANRFTGVAGARLDYHNLFGLKFTPRVFGKFAITERIDFRFTAGSGWRVPNYMVDNISLLATARQWIAPSEVKPELSWNFGGSYVHGFKLFGREANMVIDYYHTLFENQLIVDRDVDVEAIVFRNYDGRSFSNSLQGELSFEPMKRFEVRLAYKLLDVRAEYGGSLQQKVMVPMHRGFINLAYQTRNKKWEFDWTTSIFGKARLPISRLADGSLTSDNWSKVYPMMSAQVTYKMKKWEIYIGGENLTNYRQANPILDVTNPFGSTFDATRVWGPVMGTNVYVGFRFKINHDHE